MKTPSTLLALAVITSGASAFMPHHDVSARPSHPTSLDSSVAADAFFPVGRGMMNPAAGGSSSVVSTEKSAIPTPTQRPLATPASKPATRKMELFDQLKHDATVIFSIMDSDGSGTVSKQEFVNHLQSHSNSESFVDQLFDRMDLDGDGLISDPDFRSFYLTAPSLRALPGMGQSQQSEVENDKSKSLYDAIMEAGDKCFASLDKDGNGCVDFPQLKAHLTNLRKTFQDKAMMKIFSLLDADNDLTLGREEFRDAFWRYSAFRKALGESL